MPGSPHMAWVKRSSFNAAWPLLMCHWSLVAGVAFVWPWYVMASFASLSANHSQGLSIPVVCAGLLAQQTH